MGLNAVGNAFRGAVRDNLRVQPARLVAASESTAATRKRLEKTAALAGALREVDASEIAAAVGFLCGEPRQGRIGVGWATVGALDAQPAERASLSLTDVDVALTSLSEMAGGGVEQRRVELLSTLLSRATEAEQRFLRRLLVGELRQGALEGLVAAAVAEASGVSNESLRRALMLTGDLGAAAEIAATSGRRAYSRSS